MKLPYGRLKINGIIFIFGQAENIQPKISKNFSMRDFTKEELISYTTFRVTSADTDMEARLRLGALVNYLVQSAINSADSLGFGFGGIRAQQLFWVLSRLTLEISRPFKWYEDVGVETWPKKIEKIIYLRDFLVRDTRGEIVARATSGWLAVDIETKRPKKIDNIHAGIFESLHMKNAIESLPEKLLPVGNGDIFVNHTGYFDLDLNKHVTATRYVDWMMDTFSLEFHKGHYPTRLSVNYLKETMPGETLSIERRQENGNEYHFDGINLSNRSAAFRGRIDFNE